MSGFSGPQNCIPWNSTIFPRQKLSSFNCRFTGVIYLKLVWKLREILQFHNKCSTQYWIASYVGRVEFILCISSIVKLGFFDKMTHKTSSGRKKDLTPNRVFWAVNHENWLVGLGCTLGIESKNIKKGTVHVTTMWRRPCYLIKTKICMVGVLCVINYKKFEVNWLRTPSLAVCWSYPI
jgi:hypothetical protein